LLLNADTFGEPTMTVAVRAERFGIDECNSAAERDFLKALHARAAAGGWFADGWPRDDRVIITVCPSDDTYRCVLRTLRVDFDGSSVSFGTDDTHQLVNDLDPLRVDVTVVRGRPIAAMADIAADWLEREMGRPIDRMEWGNHLLWVLADTGELLVGNGRAGDTRGPPDRVYRLP
jgi:hypothetical protein